MPEKRNKNEELRKAFGSEELVFTLKKKYLISSDSKQTPNCTLFQATDTEFNRKVAIKAVPIEGKSQREIKAALDSARSEVNCMVFAEKKALAVPRVYDVYNDRKNNVFYIIMEWINGKTLREKQKASDRQFIRWMADLCDILNELDKYHYHHKDIKPENLMITNDNRIYLIDFNISVSLPNMLEGTANYKAPEMDWDSKYVSRDRSDMFSIGVIMYERFTGELPLLCEHYGNPVGNGKEWGDFIEPKEVRSDIDPEINKIITRCMKLNPKSRFNSYGELAKALRGVKYAAKENKHGTGKNRKGFSQKGRGNSRYGNY